MLVQVPPQRPKSKEAIPADGAALVIGEHALQDAAAGLKLRQGRAAQEVLAPHIVLEVQSKAKHVVPEAQHADGAALADGEHALHRAAAELKLRQGHAAQEVLVLQTAQAVQVNPSHAIPNHAANLMEDRVQAMASAVLAIAGMLMLMVMDGRLIQALIPAILEGSHLVTAMTTATHAILALMKLLPDLMVETKIVTVRWTKTLVLVSPFKTRMPTQPARTNPAVMGRHTHGKHR